VLGNWVTGDFKRRLGPSVCQEIECPYFCAKYAKPLAGSQGRDYGVKEAK
jgi:hypothetical protein